MTGTMHRGAPVLRPDRFACPTVLVVDSHDSAREALCEMLRDWGCSVLPVRNGLEGL
jgi:CheY-like chemotaxis protein